MATITDEVVIKIKIATEKAGAALKIIKEQFKGLGATIKKQAKRAAIALAGLTTALGAMVISTAKVGDEIAKMSKRLNISTEDLSALRFQAGLAGTDFRAAATGIRFMTKAMFDSTQGLETAQRGFDILGISVTETDGKLKDAQDIFLEISDALAEMEDGTEKTAAAQLLFGSRMGTQLIPLLNQGSDALREQAEEARKLGIIFDEEAARKSEILTDSMLRFRKSIEGVKNEIAFELIPKVSKYLLLIKDWILANKELIVQQVEKSIRILVSAVKELVGWFSKLTEFVRQNSELIIGLSALAAVAAIAAATFSIITGNLPGLAASLAILKTSLFALGGAWAIDKIAGFNNEFKKINIDDIKEVAKTFKGDLKLSIDEVNTAFKNLEGTIKNMPERFKTAGEAGKKAAGEIKSAWDKTSDTVKKAFEALGIIPKKQFEAQVQTVVKNFETIAKSGELTNEEVVKARAKMFEDIKTLADKAKEEGVLGIDIEDFKARLDEVQQDLISKTRDATRILKDATGQDITELKNASEIILKGFTKDSVILANETSEGIENLFEDTTEAQKTAFDKMTDEIERLAKFQFTTEDAVTKNLKTEFEERLNLTKNFVLDAEAEFKRLITFRIGQIPPLPPVAEALPPEIPEFQRGTPFITRPGLAFVDHGERIIPASQNRQDSINQNTDNRQFNIYLGDQNAQGQISIEQEFALEQTLRNLSRFDASLAQ